MPPPPPRKRPPRSPQRPVLYSENDLPLCLGYKAIPQLLSKAEAGEEGKPPRAPLQGVHPDSISDWGGGSSAGGASPLQGLHHSKDGIPGAMELKFAPSPTLPPSYLFASSSSSSSGSVAAITTSHSAAAAILPPGPESQVGGRR